MSQYGLDISEFQETPAALIDEHRPDFVICKLTEGKGYRVAPGWLSEAVGKCRQRGIPVGFYHFARPDNPVTDDLGNFTAALTDLPGGLQAGDAIALDFEVGTPDPAWATEWLTRCKRATSRVPLFYSYPSFIGQMGGPLVGWPLWLAHYASAPAYPCALWQFTDSPVDTNRFDGPDVAQFFLSLSTQGPRMYGAIINNDTDFQLARDTVHLGLGMTIYDPTSGKDIPNKLYVGAAQIPQKPYDVDKSGRNWVGITGRGIGRTKAGLDWFVRAVQAVGPPPQD